MPWARASPVALTLVRWCCSDGTAPSPARSCCVQHGCLHGGGQAVHEAAAHAPVQRSPTTPTATTGRCQQDDEARRRASEGSAAADELQREPQHHPVRPGLFEGPPMPRRWVWWRCLLQGCGKRRPMQGRVLLGVGATWVVWQSCLHLRPREARCTLFRRLHRNRCRRRRCRCR